MEELSKGNHEAYRKLFMRYYPKVRYFILGLVKSEEEADDLAQDVFVKLWTNRQQFVEVKTFGAYLYVSAKNTTFNYIESRQKRQEGLDKKISDDDSAFSPHEEMVAKDLQLLVDMVVNSMPSQRKIIYRLSREVGLSNDEIAGQLQLAKKTVENHLNLALKELRDAILLFLMAYLC